MAVAVVIIRIRTPDGREIVIETDDPNLEIVRKPGGELVRIRDPKTGQTWELDAKNLTMRDLEHPDGFKILLAGRGELTFKSSGGKVSIASNPKASGGHNFLLEDGDFRILDAKPVLASDPVELAKRSQRGGCPETIRHPRNRPRYIGRGDPAEIPPELVAVLGDVRFRCAESRGPIAISPDGKQLAVANGRNEIRFFDTQTGRLLRK